jgi:apocytochrome f
MLCLTIHISLILYLIKIFFYAKADCRLFLGYENPHEATGRIVCANFHLANKPVDIEVPQAVLPDAEIH